MYLKLFGYAALGILIIYTGQIFPFYKLPIIGKLWEQDRFFGLLFGCSFCLGFWVYFLLDFLFEINLLQDYFYVRIVSEAITGVIVSFIMHLVALGWNTKFKEININ